MPAHTRHAPPTLTIWIYDSTMGAAAGQVRLRELVHRGAVSVADAVTMTWIRGTHRPHIGHLRNARAAAATRESLLGRLVEVVTATDPDAEHRLDDVACRLAGTGIDRELLQESRAAMTPQTSALLVLSESADLDAVQPVIERGLARGDTRLLRAYLTPGALQRLDAALPAVDHPVGRLRRARRASMPTVSEAAPPASPTGCRSR